MSKEKLQSSLKALEQIIEEMNVDKAKAKIPLKAYFNKRDNKKTGNWSMNTGRNFKFFY